MDISQRPFIQTSFPPLRAVPICTRISEPDPAWWSDNGQTRDNQLDPKEKLRIFSSTAVLGRGFGLGVRLATEFFLFIFLPVLRLPRFHPKILRRSRFGMVPAEEKNGVFTSPQPSECTPDGVIADANSSGVRTVEWLRKCTDGMIL